jgi:hypothetical protein
MSERTGTQILESIERLAETAVVVLQQAKAAPLPVSIPEGKTESALYKALALAQRNFFELHKSGVIAGRNTQYAKLSDLVDASRKALLDQDLVVSTYMRDGYLISRLVHFPTGQHIESELKLLNETEEQKRGSSITYASRYTYAPLIGLVDSSYDDDGESTKMQAGRKQ